MHVIGTAGHVDHGKSTLVRALTGIDPDRLKEEKARQMTIDLGFAWFTLPGGELVGVVDVPGHRDFIENMLAGVGSIDAVIFVIAADEGVMPQTREHLAIIDLLRIPTGVIALTKIDMVSDPDWLDLVQLDILEAVGGTVLEGAPLIPVSARTGQGLDELQTALAAQFAALPGTIHSGDPRLWVDRVFSVSGFGTVVTGTLLGGQLRAGQEIEFQPGGLRGRIRGLQSHNQPLDVAQPGSRVAVNIAGIEKRDVRRGNLLTLPGTMTPSKSVAVRFRHLADATRPLRHNAEVKFFVGSAESVGRVRLLEGDSLAPGMEGWLQIELIDPLPLVKGNRFILRQPSPAETIGGGEIVATGLTRRYRRNRPEVIAGLEALARSTPAELVVHTLTTCGKPITLKQLADLTKLDVESVQTGLHAADNAVIALGDLWISQAALTVVLDRLSRILDGYHRSEPLRTGIRPENLRRQLGLDAAELEALIDDAKRRQVVQMTLAGTIARVGHTMQPTRTQRAAIDRLMATFDRSPYTPPATKEAIEIVGQDVLEALVEWGDLVQLSPDVLFTPAVVHEIALETLRIIAADGHITIKTLRDRFETSRKYAQAALEYFDNIGITRRQDDNHVIGPKDLSALGLIQPTKHTGR